MGKTEDVIMDYLSRPEILSDLFNGYVFNGEQVIEPEQLREVDSKAKLLLEDNMGKQHTYEVIRGERDIVREAVIGDKKLRLMICGVEQQTSIDYSMPLRVLAYDTLEYLKQAKQIEQKHRRKKDVSGKEFLSMFTKNDHLIPTITILFYTGKEKWDGALELDGLFEDTGYADMLEPYMVKAPLNLISIYDVKNTEKYRSSLRKIFDVLPFTEHEEDLRGYLAKHQDEYSDIDRATARVLSLLMDLEIPIETGQNEEEDGNMCKAIEEMRQSSKAEGLAEGKRQIIQNMLQKSLSLEEIADLTGVPLETVQDMAENQ